jgi:hypothetical protein
MKWENNEMSVFLREDNIIIIKVNKELKKLSVSAAEECAEKIQVAMKLNENPKVLFFYMPEIYVSKDVIRCYANTIFGEVGLVAFCETFTAWLMGNIGVTIRQRFMKSNPAATSPVKAFKVEKEAIAWSLDRIKEAL